MKKISGFSMCVTAVFCVSLFVNKVIFSEQTLIGSDGSVYIMNESKFGHPYEEAHNIPLEVMDISKPHVNIDEAYTSENIYDSSLMLSDIPPTDDLISEAVLTGPAIEKKLVTYYNRYQKVHNPQEYPYSTSALILLGFLSNPEDENSKLEWYRGSANFISDDVLITAAHNLYRQEKNDFVKEIKIYPGNNGQLPKGYYTHSDFYVFDRYTQTDPQTIVGWGKRLPNISDDIGLIRINYKKDAPKYRGGALSLTYADSLNVYDDISAQIIGYPTVAGQKYDMYQVKGDIVASGFTDYLWDVGVVHNMDTEPGSSGSAIFNDKKQVFAVHTGAVPQGEGEFLKQRDLNYGALITSVQYQIIRDFIMGNHEGWKKIDGLWRYFEAHGVMKRGWLKDAKYQKTYYLSVEEGIMAIGWKQIENHWYYFNEGGDMVIGWKRLSDKWYYLKEDGRMAIGWHKIANKWYYFNEGGDMVIGWKNISNNWYYLEENGAMATGWKQLSDKWYYLNEGSGIMVKGWLALDNKWYYLDDNGAMLKGKQVINGKAYSFNEYGALTN